MYYIRIKNWSEFQQYKDRNPPWIKLHTQLLEDDDFEELPDREKLGLLLLWLLAARLDNKLPNKPLWLQKKLPMKGKVNIELLYKQGYLEPWVDESCCDWASRYIPKNIKEKVIEKYGEKCVVCNSEENVEFDHIIPISKGGNSSENNIQPLCQKCNRKKHNREKPPYKPCTDAGKSTYTETETETETEERQREYSESFEKFWKKFKGRWNPDKGGTGGYMKVRKFEAFQEWQKLNTEEQQKAIAVADKVSGKYVPDACRWLKHKMFDDYVVR